MEATEFVTAIRERVIEKDYQVYYDILNNTNDVKDLIWKDGLQVYKSLTEEQQKSFLKLLRLIQVNTVSHIFGVIDGSTYLNEKREGFVLTTESKGEIISGDLQDTFLEMEENGD